MVGEGSNSASIGVRHPSPMSKQKQQVSTSFSPLSPKKTFQSGALTTRVTLQATFKKRTSFATTETTPLNEVGLAPVDPKPYDVAEAEAMFEVLRIIILCSLLGMINIILASRYIVRVNYL